MLMKINHIIQQAEGEDELKKRQLMELAIINGTYRDSSTKAAATGNQSLSCNFAELNGNEMYYFLAEEEWRRAAAAVAETRLLSPAMPTLAQATQLRAQQGTPLGAPLILSPRMSVPTSAASLLSGSGPPQLEHTAGLIYAHPTYTDYTNYAALAAAGNPLLTEYADHSGGLFAR